MTRCEAVQASDEMQCGRCGLTWDVNDPQRPACAPRIDKRAIPTRAATIAVKRLEGAEALRGMLTRVEADYHAGFPHLARGQASDYKAQVEARHELPAPAKPYGCHSKPRPVAGAVTHYAPDGYTGLAESCPIQSGPLQGKVVLTAVRRPIHHVMSTACAYDKSATDRRCAGCPHIAGASS